MPGTSRSGRKPKPTQLKVIQGNAGKRKINQDEPLADTLSQVPPPPTWMPELAKEAWKKLAPWLVSAKILAASDLHNLEVFCCAYSRWREAEKNIAKNGVTVPGMNNDIKNPACTAANEATKQMSTYGAALGLDPATRSRLAVPGAKDAANPFRDLVGKQR
ncbi:terminase [Pseudohongiella acticola]|uniref:Terminase n=1 Tax=Pseudohongiella acticola TaxID=1524254 RepID=A0A1E8CH74_9GAMM|nr:phage terminase small subunit P27 family [Pseudohongiella acticola]OFE11665.1 terminase [Pseudohongiella acticola]